VEVIEIALSVAFQCLPVDKEWLSSSLRHIAYVSRLTFDDHELMRVMMMNRDRLLDRCCFVDKVNMRIAPIKSATS